MIFQNPLTSLNPLFTVERHFLETIHFHDPSMPREKALAAVEKMLETLGIEKKRLQEYPHQLSGGMRQRIMIGLALIMNPDILIADEPTTSLDVIVEAGFTDLLLSLRRLYKLSIILITHNLGLVAEIADRIAVMYAGRIMEIASTEEIFARPLHPYTQGLIDCVPNILAGPEGAGDDARQPAGPRRPLRRLPVRPALPARSWTSAARRAPAPARSIRPAIRPPAGCTGRADGKSTPPGRQADAWQPLFQRPTW